MMPNSCGLFDSHGRILPLEGVHVEANVVEMISEVCLTQFYYHNSKTELQCTYKFPLHSGATICGFEAELNKQCISGELKQREVAKKEFKSAVKRGNTAYQLQEIEEDQFLISIGNIPPNTLVTIRITYISLLQLEGDFSIGFRIPQYFARTYEPARIHWNIHWIHQLRRITSKKDPKYQITSRNNNPPAFSMRIEYASTSEIIEIESPSHDIEFAYSDFSTSAVITYTNAQKPLTQDVVVKIKLQELQQPRAIIEKNVESGDVTGMIMVIPQSNSSEVKSELIFLVDLSTTNEASFNKIKTTLLQLLQSFQKQTYFNIFSYGSKCQSLTIQSQQYTTFSLKKATTFINRLNRSKRSSNLQNALQQALNSKTIPSYSRKIVIFSSSRLDITDDHHSNIRSIIIENCRSHPDTRVFYLGVCNDTDRTLVDEIANDGYGTSRCIIIDRNQLQSQLLTLLNESPIMKDISIDWGLNVHTLNIKNHPLTCSTPFHLPPIHHGSIFLVYAFLDANFEDIKSSPPTINITVTTNKQEKLIFKMNPELHHGNLIQKFAAKSMIHDLEKKRSQSGSLSYDEKCLIKEEIIKLSLKNGILSKYTSFLAFGDKLGAEKSFQLTESTSEEKNEKKVDISVITESKSDDHFQQLSDSPRMRRSSSRSTSEVLISTDERSEFEVERRRNDELKLKIEEENLQMQMMMMMRMIENERKQLEHSIRSDVKEKRSKKEEQKVMIQQHDMLIERENFLVLQFHDQKRLISELQIEEEIGIQKRFVDEQRNVIIISDKIQKVAENNEVKIDVQPINININNVNNHHLKREEIEEIKDVNNEAGILPVSGENIFNSLRKSSFLPINVLITWGLLIPNASIPTLLFWQWLNQSYNIYFNYTNRNPSNYFSNQLIIQSYLGATATACGIAVGMRMLIRNSPIFSPSIYKGMKMFLPFCAAGTAGAVNVLLMRRNELTQGISVFDDEGEEIGKSKKAALIAVRQVAASRVLTTLPILTVPPLAILAIEKTPLFTRFPRVRLPIELAIITGVLFTALPTMATLFPQQTRVSSRSLEPQFHNLFSKSGKELKEFVFNNGN